MPKKTGADQLNMHSVIRISLHLQPWITTTKLQSNFDKVALVGIE